MAEVLTRSPRSREPIAPKRLPGILLATMLVWVGPVEAGGPSCAAAALYAEQTWGLPPSVLLAIGMVESDLTPFAVNVEGRSLHPGSVDEAIKAVRSSQAAGQRSIDTGCFQVNLRWHPQAFQTLEDAFDPETNALYAARHLSDLYGEAGSWTAAVGLYHSGDPALQDIYRAKVIAAIRRLRGGVDAASTAQGGNVGSATSAHPEAIVAALRQARAAQAFMTAPVVSPTGRGAALAVSAILLPPVASVRSTGGAGNTPTNAPMARKDP
jgi:soluble lytic murein transglycosylase-like protein